jgi:hypothetical protein
MNVTALHEHFFALTPAKPGFFGSHGEPKT